MGPILKTVLKGALVVGGLGITLVSDHMAKKDLDETIAKKSAEAVADALSKES